MSEVTVKKAIKDILDKASPNLSKDQLTDSLTSAVLFADIPVDPSLQQKLIRALQQNSPYQFLLGNDLKGAADSVLEVVYQHVKSAKTSAEVFKLMGK